MFQGKILVALAAWMIGASIAGAADASQPAAAKPDVLLLWPEGAPGAMPNGGEETLRLSDQGDHIISNVHKPSLTVYLPKARKTRAAVIVVPGGGHRELWTDHEGHAVARFLNEHGIGAFMLKYRLARAPNSTYSIEGDALRDLARAIRTVRSHAAEWGIDSDKIGIIGFSAGGQLALLGAMRGDAGDAAAADPIDRASSRPDFAALIYPGPWPELKLSAESPPMFLLCGSDDRPELVKATLQIYSALREAKVPAELHMYDGVPHGFGIRATSTGPVTHWPTQFVEWMQARKIIAP